MPLKVSNTWLLNYADSDYEATCHGVTNSLTGSAIFTNPQPPLPELIALLSTFTDSASRAKGGGRAETAAKHAARLACSQGFRELGQYIDATATTLEQFLSSKYPMQKERAPIGIQPAPSNLRVKHGKVSGSLDAACDVSDHRVLYEWQTAVGQIPADWTIQPTSNSSRSTFSGFTPGTWVNTRCRFRVPAGAGDWSSVVQIMMV
ncbi:MAG: hypothetical protein V4640_04155 [Verrucomicrobiota bacterium]